MKLHFSIHYQTTAQEKLHVILRRENPALAKRQVNIALSSTDGAHWHGEGLFLLDTPITLQYHYEVRCGAEVRRSEWKTLPRRLHLTPNANGYFLIDQWRDLPAQSWLYSTAATEVLRKHPYSRPPQKPFEKTLCLCVQTPQPNPQEELGICGSADILGAWDISRARLMHACAPNLWVIVLDASSLTAPVEYKFFLRHRTTGQITWEVGNNRTLNAWPTASGQTYLYNDLRSQFPPEQPLRAAGVVLPVFSLKSQGSCGVGDFGDLLPLADWATCTHQRVIQLLPINDTNLTGSWQDSYPYNALSVYALHPLYVDARQLPPLPDKEEKIFENQRRQLNALPQVDYERVFQLKLKRLHQAFAQEAEELLDTPQFHHFFQQNAHWLPAYAMFCVLRDRYHTANFASWPQHPCFCDEELQRFCTAGTEQESSVRFWYYVQFVLHQQLLRAAHYARQKGILLKGDIPIGISPHSVEAWTDPHLFNLQVQAGAPPDDFSATGQNWGFPTYNWEQMAQNAYRWWQQRLQHMARYFDAYRLDHILGFFRIWEIPSHAVDGLLGQFNPALGLKREEIEAYGFPVHPSFTIPYISEEVLHELFGAQAKRVKKEFLEQNTSGAWQFKEAFNTQRKIAQALKMPSTPKQRQLYTGLLSLVANVLFVVDRQNPRLLHPRIGALNTSAFAALTQRQQHAFTQLYNDYFFRRHNEFWAQQASKKLPALLQATRMLCCGEDLGMVPACVTPVMQQWQILSLEIQRMPKKLGERFADTKTYPYLSVATPSTHDMSVLRAWWTENKMQTQQFWRSVLQQNGPAPQEATPEICRQILTQHLQSPSMLALIGFQDWTSMDESLRAPDPQQERINIPADPHHYWRYRMHLTLEELLQADAFNEKIKEMIIQSGR